MAVDSKNNLGPCDPIEPKHQARHLQLTLFRTQEIIFQMTKEITLVQQIGKGGL